MKPTSSWTFFCRAVLFVLLVKIPIMVSAAATEWKVNPNGQVRLIADIQDATVGRRLTLGFHFKTEPGWYVYWKNPGDSGYPPSIQWQGSEGFKDPHVLWPSPTKFVLPGNITEYGYEGEVVYPVQAELTQKGGDVRVRAVLSYLTCNTACVPYKYSFALDIPARQGPGDPGIQALLGKYLALVPAAGRTDADIQRSAPVVVKNLLPVTEAPPSHAPLSLISLMAFAFLGGLLLNVMPCVLPVLSIKLLGLVKQSGHAHALIVRNALLSAGGIVASFLGLAGVAALAKAGGRAVGWGIQFQNPIFVMSLAIVIFLFALNLWGVFEIGMPRIFGHFAVTFGQHETPTAHFMSGLFATLLATPCSAPFLGTAMGFALTQPTSTIVIAFASAGIGMSFPYLAIALFPGSLQWLPRPGVWMIRMKAVFGVLLAGTALWLVWVFLKIIRPPVQEPFDESQIERLLAEGKPVLVDVTADWCVTCKYNERFVLGSAAVRQALVNRHAVVMRADWTHKNETIRLYLARFGRSGIPFYAWYEPGKSPVLLSEFLTVPQVLKTLDR